MGITSEQLLNLLLELIANKFEYLRLDLDAMKYNGQFGSSARSFMNSEGRNVTCAVAYLLKVRNEPFHSILIYSRCHTEYRVHHFQGEQTTSYVFKRHNYGDWEELVD